MREEEMLRITEEYGKMRIVGGKNRDDFNSIADRHGIPVVRAHVELAGARLMERTARIMMRMKNKSAQGKEFARAAHKYAKKEVAISEKKAAAALDEFERNYERDTAALGEGA